MTGGPFKGVVTLGYDPASGRCTGTWIDSMNNYLWTYEGSLDKAKNLLTLETEGPCPGAPGKHSKFRESLEIKGPNRKVFTSYMQSDNGEWIKMVEIEAKRRL